MYLRGQIRIFLLILFYWFTTAEIFAQSPTEDSITYIKTINNALVFYYRSAGDQSRLYNGTQYSGYPFVFAEGNPFFLTDKMQRGTIVYDKIVYKDVDLLYDELMDVLIMQDESHRIQLSNDRISGFTILNYRFIHLVNDSLNNSAPQTGFYNILYDGNLCVLKKEIKTIREIVTFSVEEKTRVIDLKSEYYFRKNNEYFKIKNQKGLLDFFQQQKSVIKHFIKTNKLNFKKDTDNLLEKVAAYGDQLTK